MMRVRLKRLDKEKVKEHTRFNTLIMHVNISEDCKIKDT